MTALVAIMNRKGAIIASDRAGTGNPITWKNSAKTLTLNEILPISVMISGNNYFLKTPWSIIVNQYRYLHGKKKYSKAEDCVRDFYDFISKNDVFLTSDYKNNKKNTLEETKSPINNRSEEHQDPNLIFTGYGTGDTYPKMIKTTVYEDINNKSYYYLDKCNYVSIDKNTPAAIRFFATPEVYYSLLSGLDVGSINRILYSNDYYSVEIIMDMIGKNNKDVYTTEELKLIKSSESLSPIYNQNLRNKLSPCIERQRIIWEKSIKDYSLEEMAKLAQSLIDLTSLYHTINNLQECVGGSTDVAQITEGGIKWLKCEDLYAENTLHFGNTTITPLNR